MPDVPFGPNGPSSTTGPARARPCPVNSGLSQLACTGHCGCRRPAETTRGDASAGRKGTPTTKGGSSWRMAALLYYHLEYPEVTGSYIVLFTIRIRQMTRPREPLGA